MEILSIIDDIPVNVDSLRHFSEYLHKKEKMEILCGRVVSIGDYTGILKDGVIFEIPKKVGV